VIKSNQNPNALDRLMPVHDAGCGCGRCAVPARSSFGPPAGADRRTQSLMPAYVVERGLSVRQAPATFYQAPAALKQFAIAQAMASSSGDAVSGGGTGVGTVVLTPTKTRLCAGFIFELAVGANDTPPTAEFDITWIDNTTGESRNTGSYIVDMDCDGRARMVIFNYVPVATGALIATPRLAVLGPGSGLSVNIAVPANSFGNNIPAALTNLTAAGVAASDSATLNVSSFEGAGSYTFRTLASNDSIWDKAIAYLMQEQYDAA